MRGDLASSAARVGDKVGELMFECALGFVFGKFAEPWVHLDAAVRPERSADGGSHAFVPDDSDFLREFS